jgi:hypothetical protein
LRPVLLHSKPLHLRPDHIQSALHPHLTLSARRPALDSHMRMKCSLSTFSVTAFHQALITGYRLPITASRLPILAFRISAFRWPPFSLQHLAFSLSASPSVRCRKVSKVRTDAGTTDFSL